MQKGKVEILLKNKKILKGYYNGKTYGDHVYVSGIKVPLDDIVLSSNLVVEMRGPSDSVLTYTRNNIHGHGYCHACETYCDGDCRAK